MAPVTIQGDAYFRRMQVTRKRAIKALEEQGIAADKLRVAKRLSAPHVCELPLYAAFKNAGVSAKELGHGGGLTIFFRHHYDRVKEHEALEFWKIYPHSPEPFSVVAA